jgi:hypothetical protein
MNAFRAVIATAALLMGGPPEAYAQVRVITPDSEHVYSSDPARPQQLPDDEALQLQNERAEKARIARERERDRQEIARRQEVLDREYARRRAYQPPTSAWKSPNVYQPPKSGWADR